MDVERVAIFMLIDQVRNMMLPNFPTTHCLMTFLLQVVVDGIISYTGRVFLLQPRETITTFNINTATKGHLKTVLSRILLLQVQEYRP